MAKSTTYKNALTQEVTPDLFRKGYLFKRIDKDVNGNVSSFHDVKTMYKGLYNNNSLAIYSDLHYTEWDHSYGTENCNLIVTPESTSLGVDAWTRSPSSGGATTRIAPIGAGGSQSSGTLLIEATSAQTLTYTRTNVFDTVSSAVADTSGCGTIEFEFRKGVSEAANNNPFRVQIKCGTFQMNLIINRVDFELKEVGAATGVGQSTVNLQDTSWAATSPDGRGSYESGQYLVFRIIINKKCAGAHAWLLVNGQSVGVIAHTINNATANSIQFGYNAAPTSTSQSFIGYFRYHNAPFFPNDTYKFNTVMYSLFDNSTSLQPTANRWTNSLGSTPALALRGTNTMPNKSWCYIDCTGNALDSLYTQLTGYLNTNAVGNALEFVAELRSPGSSNIANAKAEFSIGDGTRLNVVQFLGSGSGSIVINPQGASPVTIVGVTPITQNAYTVPVIRMVVKGTNTYIFINGVQYDGVTGSPGTTAFTNSTASGTLVISMRFYRHASAFNFYCLHRIGMLYAATFPTRNYNNATLSKLIGSTVANEKYTSDVVVNNVNTTLLPPQLGSLLPVVKDLSYSDTNSLTKFAGLQYRGSNTAFVATDVSPSWTTMTPSTDFNERDFFTVHNFTYFQIRVNFVDGSEELEYMRFHRQIDVTDYITRWGTCSFSRDPITKALSAGNVNIQLMNPDGDFNLFRDNPEFWVDAQFEIWIGVRVSGTDYSYPDFVGIIQDMTFNETARFVELEVANIIKFYKDFTIGTQFSRYPFNQFKIYAGTGLENIPLRVDPTNPLIYYADTKYPVRITNVYVDGVLKVFNTDYRQVSIGPSYIRFITSTVGGTVTCDITPLTEYNTANANNIMKLLFQKEANLLLNHDIDVTSFNAVDTFISAVTVGNLVISNIKLLDFLESMCNQVGCTLYLKDDSQCQLAIEKTNVVHDTYELISYNNISDSYMACTQFSKKHPIENLINIVDVKFNSVENRAFYTYINRNTVGTYDASSSRKNDKIIDVYGKKYANKLVSQATGQSKDVSVEYPFLTNIVDVANTTEINYSPYGNRPPLYDIGGMDMSIFNISLQTVLEFHRDSSTEISDFILITRLDKNYDDFTGSLQGISNVFREIPGGVNFVFAFATDAGTGTIDVDYWTAVNGAPMTITGITKANPAVVTTSGTHGFIAGDIVYIDSVLGMTEVNDLSFTVGTVTSTTFQLSGINSSGYTTYTSGGNVEDVDTAFART